MKKIVCVMAHDLSIHKVTGLGDDLQAALDVLANSAWVDYRAVRSDTRVNVYADNGTRLAFAYVIID